MSTYTILSLEAWFWFNESFITLQLKARIRQISRCWKGWEKQELKTCVCVLFPLESRHAERQECYACIQITRQCITPCLVKYISFHFTPSIFTFHFVSSVRLGNGVMYLVYYVLVRRRNTPSGHPVPFLRRCILNIDTCIENKSLKALLMQIQVCSKVIHRTQVTM